MLKGFDLGCLGTRLERHAIRVVIDESLALRPLFLDRYGHQFALYHALTVQTLPFTRLGCLHSFSEALLRLPFLQQKGLATSGA